MAVFVVSTNADKGAGSLRAAVSAANARAGADEIRFDAAVFDGGPEDVIRLGREIRVTDALTIVGGPRQVTITGDVGADDVTVGGLTDVAASVDDRLDDNVRIFDATASLTVDGLILTGGRASGDDPNGGAIRSAADLRLIGVSVVGNVAMGDGGGVFAESLTMSGGRLEGNVADEGRGYALAYYAGRGGGAFAVSSLVVEGGVIARNVSYYDGGGLYGGDVRVNGAVLEKNEARYGGAAIGAALRADVHKATISDNIAGVGVGGIKAAHIEIHESHVTHNSADLGTGGLSGDYVLVNRSELFGNGGDHHGGVSSDYARIIDSVIRGNSGEISAGGVRSRQIYVSGSTVSENWSRWGGGGLSGTTVSVVSSLVSENQAMWGGGISGGRVTLVNSTVADNTAFFDEFEIYSSYGVGGGVRAREVVARNSTITGNVVESTLAGSGGGAIDADSIVLENSIVSGNSAITEPEIRGSVTLRGGNILGLDLFRGAKDAGDVTAAGVFARVIEIAPGVFAGVLGDHGGRTWTAAIRGDGAAAGWANPAFATGIDQRGTPRDAAPDLGAFESAPLVLVGGPGADTLVGADLADRIRGKDGDDRLRGREGNDQILGDAGNDTVLGDEGDDRLEGGFGDDVIRGNAGRDQIAGGPGADVLQGGSGRDLFIFGPSFGRDDILDFDGDAKGGQDRIDLRLAGIASADFATAVSIERSGQDALVEVGSAGVVVVRGIYGRDAGLDLSDFLLV